MSVKRYEWVACDEHSCHCDVVESAEGDMVDYEDYAALEARCTALAAEVYDLKHPGTYLPSKRETPATDAFLAEVRAHDLNAFIRHHSAELDAHIKNGGEQFDEKSVRIRDIIVSARLFREQIRKEAAQ
ncbi:hypothetical protein [Enterobacter asburiae]|uniref:hypothetical protein n=1 Tax=Enterobacter asburiae TaxID=61645 RepID=UPI002075EA9A|nr:hypothetical protein [Enterobacter asburiae]MCM7018735.1 hypothetical protein [Enterobacter asburiae]